MRPELYNTYKLRLKKTYQRIQGRMMLKQKTPLQAEFCHSKEPVKFADRLNGEFKPITKGQKWGNEWESAWFHITGEVPAEWAGENVVAHLDFGGESLIFDETGCPIYGLTDGSVFVRNYSKDIHFLFEKCKGGEKIDLWVEAAANRLFGIARDDNPARDCPQRHGNHEGKVVSLELATFNKEVWHLGIDLKQLYGLFVGNQAVGEKAGQAAWGSRETLVKLTPRAKRILYIANKALDVFADNTANASKARDVLKPLFDCKANDSAITINAVGHAHIDTGWLWPVRETIRKSARTFASQLALIERYPDYIFGASQPQHYQFVKEHYPQLYAKIKDAIKKGQWECQGGMWVEADCNVISGESMVRQFVHGKNFFMDEFGVDVRNLWIPDVFGYSAAMPQIMKKTGVEYFLTQKISWSQFNQFPHNTFVWRGLDGSEVITHFPPEDNYNSDGTTETLISAQENFKESHILDEAMCLFGIGNGGGGPKEEHIENIKRLADLEGSPKLKFGTAEAFFDRIEKHRDELEVWDGELYLELHRATLTTQAKTKKGNRTLERKLREAEFICSMLPVEKYPQQDLDRIWKVLLINQFHDILPGSSINLVYQTTEKEYADSIAECDELIKKASKELLNAADDKLTLVNILTTEYTAPVKLPDSWTGCGAVDESGKALPVQEDENGVVLLATIPALSTLQITKSAAVASETTSALVLENSLVRYEFADDGTITSAVDKETGKEILTPGEKGNLLSLYIDRPHNWDAWDIDITYENELMETARAKAVTPLSSGSVRKGIKFSLQIGEQSTIEQSVYLNEDSKRLDFCTKVEWQEFHKMLRVSFPANVLSKEAAFDVQYGYAKRPTHRNTSWDMAKFEVAAHKYADLSAAGYGVALLNDCKYGYKVHENVLDLNLLRSSSHPDADADRGTQEFTYSLLPHCGELAESNVIEQAQMLNFPPVTLEGTVADKLQIPVEICSEGVSLEVLKKAEKSNDLVIRLVETKGTLSSCKITLKTGSKLVETNMMEWVDSQTLEGTSHEVTLSPFEIRTYKIC